VVRWERLFDDLEAQLEAGEAAELDAEIADRALAEVARLRLVDRVRASAGALIEVDLGGGMRASGVLRRVGADWLLLEPGEGLAEGGGETVVPIGAVHVVRGLGRRSSEPGSEGLVAAKLSFGYALRRLAADRARVLVTLADGRTVAGRMLRVGADFVELAEEIRPEAPLVVPTGNVVSVRRSAG
jgi:hypothetical protein